MKLVGNLNFRSRPALLGAFVAWQLAVAFAAFAPAFIAAPAQAQKPVTCFMRGECIDSKTRGNCDNQHCFEVRKECPPGQGLCYANPPAVPLTISIGGHTVALDMSDYIIIVFNYGVGVAGLIATVMFMVGGFQYLTAGTSDRTSKGKERIKNAIVGMLLVFGAMLILRTVNPDTLKLQMPKIEITKRSTVASCAYTEMCEPCGVPYVVLTDKATGDTAKAMGQCNFAKLRSEVAEADLSKYDLSQCVGMGCSGSGAGMIPYSSDDKAKCSSYLFRCNHADANDTFQCGHVPTPPKDAPPSPAGTSGGYVCKSCLPDGATCAASGKNDSCCGGFCSGSGVGLNTCASGQPGDACQDDKQCITGKCQTNWGNSCSAGEIGSPCGGTDAGSECKTGYKCSTFLSNTCSPGTKYSYCDEDSECQSPLRCVKLTGYAHVCMDVPDDRDKFKAVVCPIQDGVVYDTCCRNNADCASRGGFCNTMESHFCTDGSPGAPCDSPTECASGFCSVHTCTTGVIGSACDDDNGCASHHCSKAGDFKVCTSGGIGARCDDVNDCNDKNVMVCEQHRCGPKGDATQ